MYGEIGQLIGSPPIPSDAEKDVLRQLESLKVSDPSSRAYDIQGRSPEVCGIQPESTVVEVRVKETLTALTYWYFWRHDRFPGDHEDWEPVTLLYSGGSLTSAYGRVHNCLISFVPKPEPGKQIVFFGAIGHTPVLKVRDSQHGFQIHHLNDGLDGLRKAQIVKCYGDAQNDGWKIMPQVQLQLTGAPSLGGSNWHSWGKHSVYLKI